jgi:hypothetical protein
MDDVADRIVADRESNIQVYLVKKIGYKNNYEAVLFPNKINDTIKQTYAANYIDFTADKNVVEYDSVHSEKGTIKKVLLADLAGWQNMKDAMDTADRNRTILNKNTFSDNYNCIVLVYSGVINRNVKTIFLISQYRKIDTWYKKSVKFAFTTNNLVLKNKDIFVLNGCIDTVIADDSVYVLQETPFEKVFNFYERAKKTVTTNKDAIERWSFIDRPSEFYNSINEKKGPTTKLARAIEKRAEDFARLSPQIVKASLSRYDQFTSIAYDDQDRIVFSTANRDLIIDILRHIYARGLFSNDLIRTKGV